LDETCKSYIVAASSYEFVECVKTKLGVKVKNREIHRNGNGSTYALQEPVTAYSTDFKGKNYSLRSG
jgi:hypothetical protein